MRDSQKSKVYHAENILRQIVDNSRDNPTFKIEGITLTLPPEAKFSSVEDVKRYVDKVVHLPAVAEKFGVFPVAVRSRKGQRIAHYESFPPTVAVPENGTRWALREIVVLHELAHHYAGNRAGHGPKFADTFITLLGLVMGPEMGLLSRIIYQQNDVKAA